MSPMAIAWVVFACVVAGTLLGMLLRKALPEDHLSADTKDMAKVAVALIATMGALVLSLLLSSTKSSYDTRNSELVQVSGQIVLLDNVLAHYGPEAADARAMLRRAVTVAIDRLWPNDGARPVGADPTAAPVEILYDKIEALSPQTEAQRSLKTQALQDAMEISRLRLLLFNQMGSSIPLPFLIVLVFWLTVIFGSLGLFAPSHATITAFFLICALSVSGAIFLILELDQPFAGMIELSSTPLRQALGRLSQ